VAGFARPDLFLSTEEVANRLRDPKVRIVDCRFSFDADATTDYRAGHLPGAHSVPLEELPTRLAELPADALIVTYCRGPLCVYADEALAQIVASGLGYDAEGGHHAARLWLGLQRYGHDRMSVMEGGIQKWLAEKRPTEPGEVTPPKAKFTARAREGVLASKDDVLAAVRKGDPWLLDVRRDSEFTGEEKRAARGGHIPGAVNVLWRDALKDDWTLKDPDELEEMYANAGFGAETSTVTYCQAGVRAAFTHLVLAALGHDDVRTYDGSWEEWGNEPSLPIIVGRS